MLCGLAAVLKASGLDGVAFDPFSFQQDGLTPPEVDISRRQIADALVAPQMVVVGDEITDVLLEIAREVVVLEQAPVLELLMLVFGLAMRRRMQRHPALSWGGSPSTQRHFEPGGGVLQQGRWHPRDPQNGGCRGNGRLRLF
jgi:hypothetical protein